MVSNLVEELSGILRTRGLMMAAAESCTGGLVAAAMTDLAGSSDVFERGFVTYSNESKQEMLGVSPEVIERHGAVSGPCVQAMAEGALKNSRADIAVSISGVAGPGGGSPEKPVGLVWFGCALSGRETHTESHVFTGNRAEIRSQAVQKALELLIEILKEDQGS